uniref:Macaca fascicularis brain cDNA clone: QmoA-12068, similar to human RAB22A, member RAS oncogene family (RAB22A), mRNA, RefSeq: NM_020673.2 n=1 Tax=Macaca fascicularis TaxID=9541 RepID=I7GEB8_MACFA|nr:unnamed protein product [Macaca fascicularis]
MPVLLIPVFAGLRNFSFFRETFECSTVEEIILKIAFHT